MGVNRVLVEHVATLLMLVSAAVGIGAMVRVGHRFPRRRRDVTPMLFGLILIAVPLLLEAIGIWRGVSLFPKAYHGFFYAAFTLAMTFGYVRSAKRANEMLEHFEDLAISDELTRVLNRRGFAKHMEKWLRTDWRRLSPTILFFVDLDGFKEVNDQYGHDQGDDLLREVAQTLAKAAGPSGLCGRLGGDEFTLAVPAKDIDNVDAFVERLCKDVRSVGKSMGAFIDASVGYSFFPTEGKDLEELLRAADNRMYRVKRSRIRLVSKLGETKDGRARR